MAMMDFACSWKMLLTGWLRYLFRSCGDKSSVGPLSAVLPTADADLLAATEAEDIEDVIFEEDASMPNSKLLLTQLVSWG